MLHMRGRPLGPPGLLEAQLVDFVMDVIARGCKVRLGVVMACPAVVGPVWGVASPVVAGLGVSSGLLWGCL